MRQLSKNNGNPISPEALEALEKAHKDYYAKLRYYARTIVGDPGAADSIISDVFVGVFERDTDLNTVGSVESYLRRAAYWACIDHLRRENTSRANHEKWQLDSGDPRPEPSQEDHLQRVQLLAELDKLIQKLPDRAREAIIGHFREDKTIKELAAQMGIEPVTVHRHIAEGMKGLLRMVKGKDLRTWLILNLLMWIQWKN